MSLTEFPVVKNLDQTVWLAFAVVMGAVFCLVYEILKAFRAEIPHKNIAVFFEDVLFFVFCAFGYFCFALVSDDGMIKLYSLLAALFGSVVTRLLLGRLFQKMLRPVFRVARNAALFLIKNSKALGYKIRKTQQKIKRNLQKNDKNKKNRKKALKSAKQM